MIEKLKALLVLFLLVLTSAHAADAPGKTFTFRLYSEPETLDWNLAHTSVEVHLMNNLMEGLLTFDDKLKVVPALAEKFTKSPDGRTYTFTIRKGVKWSDGVALTAKDFEYGWKRLLSPTTAAAYAYLLYDVEGAEAFNKGSTPDFSKVGIHALDERTFQVKLTKPVAHWIYIPTFWVTYPVREDLVTKHGNAWARAGKMVTVGPFTLSTHDIDSKIVMDRNPLYWGPRGNLDRVVCLIVKDDATALNLYRAGKIDFLTDLPTVDLTKLEGNPELKRFPYLKTGYLGFVHSKYPLSDVRFRRALAMSIDRSKLGGILRGGQTAATTFAPPPLLSYSPKIGIAFDPVKAKKELQASGWKPGGKTPVLELLISNFDRSLLLAQYLQAEVKKNLGIEIAIQPFDHKTFRAQMDLRLFPLYLLTWGADYPDPDNFLSVFLSESGNNRTSWKSAKYDELVLKARTGKTDAERRELYQKAEKILVEDEVAVLPLYYEPNLVLVKPRVKGFRVNELNYVFLRNVSVE